ncbi:hypothetical protein D3OALGA1CA_739 [Olavius algarvensis associated proteobacterium Delta 3]|nr:hypothetical protein D3OALGA1CA_739 [Olavius algarvensis associated proteobacterium Delta 3]
MFSQFFYQTLQMLASCNKEHPYCLFMDTGSIPQASIPWPMN